MDDVNQITTPNEESNNIEPIYVAPEDMKHMELIQMLNSKNAYIEHLEKKAQDLDAKVKMKDADIDQIVKSAENVVTTLEAYHERRVKAVIDINKAIEVLVSKPRFSKEEK